VDTLTPTVLLEKETLQSWIDAGLVNAPLGSERVVILDVDHADAPNYSNGHIPGAQFWDCTQHVEKRLEGPAPAVNMVVTADRMNTLIQEHGIDENTTIVITSSLGGATYFPSRAYFLFRYYGWPKERLKVLNGYNGAFTADELTTDVPAVTPSTLTVQAVGDLQHDFRVSLPELMDAVRDGRGMAVDMRGDKTSTGSTAGVYGDVTGDYVVFEGRPVGGGYFDWTQFNVDFASGDYRFKSAADLRAALMSSGIDGSEMIYSYCRTGYIASTGFFVLDGILGWPVMTYDGSWSQWGKMSDDADKGGELPTGSPWALDNATYMEILNYNVENTLKVEPLNPDPALLGTSPGDSEVNQVESEDTSYQAEPSASDGGGASGPPTPVDSPAIGC
jgi:3-mercaptopyruvate sulfurtransferase SseA